MKERKRNRLPEYDYSNQGYYFITICTHEHKSLFGHISNSQMRLNLFGEIIEKNWFNMEALHDYIDIDEFIIMPNHLHGIIIVNNYVGDEKFSSPTLQRMNMTLPKIIKHFKPACTLEIRNILKSEEKIWQRSFYDRVIRNEKELYQIRKYIQQNPLQWDL